MTVLALVALALLATVSAVGTKVADRRRMTGTATMFFLIYAAATAWALFFLAHNAVAELEAWS